MAEKSKSKGGSAVKNVVMILFIVAAGLFVWKKVEQRQTIARENQAVALLEEGKYEEAIAMFDTLAAKATGEARERHNTNLARCYAGQAEDSPNLSVAQQMDLYRRAASYDETVIKNPVILRALKEAEAKLTAQPTPPPAE